ncbi:MAG: hypothetical protein ACREH3_15275, partial [Geminicoccales bacterium]
RRLPVNTRDRVLVVMAPPNRDDALEAREQEELFRQLEERLLQPQGRSSPEIVAALLAVELCRPVGLLAMSAPGA